MLDNTGHTVISYYGVSKPINGLVATDIVKSAQYPNVQRRKDDHDKGVIYFLQSGGLIKIGFTTNVVARVKKLRSTSPVDLTLLGTAYCHKRLERRLHAKFATSEPMGSGFANLRNSFKQSGASCHEAQLKSPHPRKHAASIPAAWPVGSSAKTAGRQLSRCRTINDQCNCN